MTTTSYSLEGAVIESLGVADAGVVRQEKPVQQRVHPQQPGSRERNPFWIQFGQEALRLERFQLRAETVERIDRVLVMKVSGPDRPTLQLENELANEPLVRVRPVGTPERQLTGFERGRVFL